MITDLKPYPAMKDSGVPWLGEVPEDWGAQRLKNCVTINRSTLGEDTPADFEFDYLDIGAVATGRIVRHPSRMRFSEAPSRARRIIGPGDTVVSTVRTYLKAVFTVGESPRPLVASTGFAVLSPRDGAIPRYLGYMAQSDYFTNQVTAESVGIAYPAISETKFANIPVTLPPLPEQAAIVRYLDYVDRRIRRYIRAKQKLIKLLEEQKQAIIHQAVTRGLDPNVRLKPSGVEWLGDVPEHWEVVRSKRLFAPRTELALPGDVQLSATQAYGVISQMEYERRIGRKLVKIFRHLEKRRHVEVDDFVISMRSFQGGLERAWESGCIRSSYVVLRPNRDLCVPYFARLFKSPGFIGALQATANFIRDGQDLNYGNFCAVDLPWPPLDEQARIAEAIDGALSTAMNVGERAAQEIALLQEYRTRLIADVVTGKLDVREVAARLPEEVEEQVDDDSDIVEEDAAEYGDGDAEEMSE